MKFSDLENICIFTINNNKFITYLINHFCIKVVEQIEKETLG